MGRDVRRTLSGITRDQRWGFAAAVLATAVLTGILAPMHSRIGLLNVGLIYLLLTLLVSATWGWQVGVFAAILTNLAFNFFFVPPLYRFSVYRPEHVAALIIFLGVSVIGGYLLSQARASAENAQRRQAETEVLLGLNRDLIGRADPAAALGALCDNVVRAFEAPGASVLSESGGRWSVLAAAGDSSARRPPDRSEALMAERAVEVDQLTWAGHTGLSDRRRPRIVLPGPQRRVVDVARGVAFVPLRIGERMLGVLRLDGPIGRAPFRDHPEQLLDAFAREAALGVERMELVRVAAHTEALREADELKTALLSSVSHDLKTPLAGIKAAVSSLLDRSVRWTQDDVASFLETIDSQADRLDRVISDILDLNRIESGAVRPVRHVASARQLLEEAIARVRASTAGRTVSIEGNDELMVETDESLVLQALVNLIENAAKYSTEGGDIRLRAERRAGRVELSVADVGPGIPDGDVPHVFERFYRSSQTRRVKGSGLGLAIVKGFVTLSGGSVRVESSPRGARFVITLPAAVGAEVA
jgi:two-component system, OmpR family, sensor histidine kinase KdpD